MNSEAITFDDIGVAYERGIKVMPNNRTRKMQPETFHGLCTCCGIGTLVERVRTRIGTTENLCSGCKKGFKKHDYA